MKRAHTLPMRSADEYDALTKWHRVLYWKPGERKAIKRRYNRRVRRVTKQELREQ